jgi:hypothetical protein
MSEDHRTAEDLKGDLEDLVETFEDLEEANRQEDNPGAAAAYGDAANALQRTLDGDW